MNTNALLAYGFRPFFLLVGIFGALTILAWMGFLFGGWPLPLGWSAVHWHSHEMLYGLVPAAIAGFLLTAITNWTGARPVQGRALLALVVLWIAGRVAMACASWLPLWLVSLVDLAFLPAIAIYVAAVLIRYKNWRNLILIIVLALLTAGNLLMHVGFNRASIDLLRVGQIHGFDVITLLMAVIAGRITPAFSANWLRARGGNPTGIRVLPWLDRLSLISIASLLPLTWFAAPAMIVGGIALIAGCFNLLRLLLWAGWRVVGEPLLWILHLAYLWIATALLLRGAAAFSDAIPATAWQHLLGVGGIATLILGVMTRVAMGHTGRPLRLPRFGLAIYLSIIAATLLRFAAALQWIDFRVGVNVAAFAWFAAFALFVAVYLPILSQPRPDGRPG